MTEDDETKQRAHEVANQSQSLYPTACPHSTQSHEKRGQMGAPQSPIIETKELLAFEQMANHQDQGETTGVNKGHERAGDNQEVNCSERGKVAEVQQNATQIEPEHSEHKTTDSPNRDQKSTIPATRHNRRHHYNNNNNNNNMPNNHQQKHNQQYTPAMVMSYDTTTSPLVSAEYLTQLIKDKKQLAAFPSTVFLHAHRLVEEEIQRVRQQLFPSNDMVSSHQLPLELPEPDGEFVSLQEKIYVPVDQHPEYNFVGRLLGPRGMTAKQLEQETGCKIMIRGKGSMRDKKKEEQNKGKANWEHLNDDLHVLITVEDTQCRAQIKLGRAIQEVRQLLIPIVDGEDELKKRQLMELAIINGTYRDCNYNEALGKMLNDAAHRQSQLVEHDCPTFSGQQQMMATAATSASSSGSPPSGPHAASRLFLTHLQHYPSSTTASTNLDGSSGFPSTGSTPNSLHHNTSHQQVVTSSQNALSRHQSHPLHGQHPAHHQHPGSTHHMSHPTTVAVVAAAAAAAAAQQHQQISGPPQSAPHNHHHHNLHAHSHQSSAAAAAAAAAALMSNPAAEANAILYAQQYHDFQHYAAMAAAAAASHQPILQPPSLDYNPHHPHHAYPPPLHPHSHHHQAAVAQAVAAATAANQQFHRQIAEQQHQQNNAETLASAHEMVNYHQQDHQIDNGNNQNDFRNLPLIEESSGVTIEQSSEQEQEELQQEHIPDH